MHNQYPPHLHLHHLQSRHNYAAPTIDWSSQFRKAREMFIWHELVYFLP